MATDTLDPKAIDAFMSLDEGQQRTALGSLSDEYKQQLLSGIQSRQAPAGPSSVSPIAPPAVADQRPGNVPFTLGGPGTFSQKVGQRIKENVQLPFRAIDAAMHPNEPLPDDLKQFSESMQNLTGANEPTTAGKVYKALTVGPRMAIQQAEDYYHNPEHLVGDAVLAAPELVELPEKIANIKSRGKSSIPSPPEAANPNGLTPEQQTKYTAALDKANADYKVGSREYYNAISRAFDDAKRTQLESRAAHQQTLDELKAKHDAAAKQAQDSFDADAQKYHEALSDQFDKAKQQQIENAAQYQRDKSAWIEENRKHYQDSQAAEAAFNKKAALERGAQEYVRMTHDNLAQAHDTAKSALNQRWDGFREKMEGAALDPASTFNMIEQAKAKFLRGSPGSLTLFNNLIKEMGVQDFKDLGNGQMEAIPGSGKLPFDTGRVHYSAIGDRLAQGGLPGNVFKALEAVKEGLNSQLEAAAESRKIGPEYRSLKADEAQFRKDWNDSDSPLAKAYEAQDPNFLEPHLKGRGTDMLIQQLSRYREFGANPRLPVNARRLWNQSSAISELPVPKEPGAAPSQPEIPQGRMPRAPQGPNIPPPPGMPEAPGIPEKLVTKKAPELAKVARPMPPEPEPPKAGKYAKMAAKVVGKVGGAAVVPVHPFVGAALGGQLAPELLDQYVAARAKRQGAIPPPPRK